MGTYNCNGCGRPDTVLHEVSGLYLCVECDKGRRRARQYEVIREFSDFNFRMALDRASIQGYRVEHIYTGESMVAVISREYTL